MLTTIPSKYQRFAWVRPEIPNDPQTAETVEDLYNDVMIMVARFLRVWDPGLDEASIDSVVAAFDTSTNFDKLAPALSRILMAARNRRTSDETSRTAAPQPGHAPSLAVVKEPRSAKEGAAEAELTRLAVVLEGDGWAARVVSVPGRGVWLRVVNPDDAALEDCVIFRCGDEGPSFWWSYGELIGPVDALRPVADAIKRALVVRPPGA